MKKQVTGERYVLKLYVAGASAKSTDAIANLQKATKRLGEQSIIEIIDVLRTPESAIENHITAIPTLIKSNPPPVRRIVGDLSDIEKVSFWLEQIRLLNNQTVISN